MTDTKFHVAGVTQKTFAEELTAEGHPISYADFRTLLARARKQLKAAASPAENVTQERREEEKTEPETPTQTHEIEPTHRPSDLDAIQAEEVDLRSLAKFAKRNRK